MTTTNDHQPLDYVIVGQGIAGTTLAWLLKWRGLRGLIIDRDDGKSSSKVAAGLMTPVTGKRLVPSWRLDETWAAADDFYRRVEAETSSPFLTQPGQARLFNTEESKEEFDRRDWSEHPVEIRQPQKLVDAASFDAPLGGFELPTARRLDVPAYLAASRAVFVADGTLRIADLNSATDLEFGDDTVVLTKHSLRTKRVIFCQGALGATNPLFADVEFKAARGEILTLKIDGLTETRIVNQGVWLVPCGDGIFKAGSTYDFENLTPHVTNSGRDEIVERLRNFLKLPFEIVGHEAGVRPVVLERRPIIGVHRTFPQLAIFNGLGSKGSLLAPFVAGQLAKHLFGGSPIDSELDYQTRFQPRIPKAERPRVPRLTEQAQTLVGDVVKSGETAIDATAGNGHDTCFLAKAVGYAGRVFAFDVQSDALQRTSARLADIGYENVTLLQRSHAEMKDALPDVERGSVAAVMFNLGYLPGGDHSVTTRTESSLSAISTALNLVRSGGIVTVLVYPGHLGGDDEADSVGRLIEDLPPAEFETSIRKSATTSETAPMLYVIVRL
ncbi:MAG: FAD-dependent oxidoreductase [Planctomycetaceae bacterium]|nr:FAD-dependent oxidoreductase [Planctomycetaceae bacterium]